MGEIYASASHHAMGHPCLAGDSSQSKRRVEWRRDPLWLEEHDYCLSSGPKFRPVQYFSKLPGYLVQLKLEFGDTDEGEDSGSDSESWASPASTGSSSSTLTCSPSSSPCLTSSSQESSSPKSNSTQQQIQERRVLFVGKLPDTTTKDDLRRRFSKFGIIEKVSIYFRKNADNYGFVTFQDSSSTYDAYQNGNNDPSEPRVDLCFGERRQFCSRKYMDLDALSAGAPNLPAEPASSSLDFDGLLMQALQSKSAPADRRPSLLTTPCFHL